MLPCPVWRISSRNVGYFSFRMLHSPMSSVHLGQDRIIRRPLKDRYMGGFLRQYGVLVCRTTLCRYGRCREIDLFMRPIASVIGIALVVSKPSCLAFGRLKYIRSPSRRTAPLSCPFCRFQSASGALFHEICGFHFDIEVDVFEIKTVAT